MIAFALIFLFLCVVFSAFLSSSETALFSLSTFTVKSFKEKKNGPPWFIYQLLNKPKDLLVSILMLNVFTNIIIQNVFSSLFKNTENFFVVVGIPLMIVLIFGEIIPKSLAFYQNQKIASLISPILFPITQFLSPLRRSLIVITEILSYPFFLFLKKETPLSLKELQDLLQLSHEKNILEKEEQELLSNYLQYQTLLAKEKMIPREEITYFDVQENDVEKIPEFFHTKQVSRILICNQSIDAVVGILSLQSYIKHQKKIASKEELLSLCKSPFFVPETIKASSLLKQMHLKKESLALIVDEYGSVQGLITDKDIISFVVGQEKESEQNCMLHPADRMRKRLFAMRNSRQWLHQIHPKPDQDSFLSCEYL